MKLMKWNDDKLKIYLTLDELLEKGITAEDLKVDCEKVHDIVQEIVNEACREFGFMLAGSIAVEIYSMQQEQGLIMIVSKDEDYPFCEDDEDVFYKASDLILHEFRKMSGKFVSVGLVKVTFPVEEIYAIDLEG